MLPAGLRPPVYSPLGSIKTPSGLIKPMIPWAGGVIISQYEPLDKGLYSPPDAACAAGTVSRVEGDLGAGAGGRARPAVARAGVAAQPAAVVEGGAGAAHRQAALRLLLDLEGNVVLHIKS